MDLELGPGSGRQLLDHQNLPELNYGLQKSASPLYTTTLGAPNDSLTFENTSDKDEGLDRSAAMWISLGVSSAGLAFRDVSATL